MQRKCNDIKSETYLMVLGVLFVFGIIYDKFVSWLEYQGHEQGNTAWLVVLGDGITVLMAWPLFGFKAFAQIFGLFVASGTPMLLGSIKRFWEAQRKADHHSQKALARVNEKNTR